MPECGVQLMRLQELYDGYLEQADKAERSRSPMAGAFGTKGGPADDPCHERFAEDLRALLDGCPQAELRPGELCAMLERIYAPPAKDCPQSAYWMLLAVHGLTERLIPLLDRAEARSLWERYRRDHPRSRLLPVQKKILRMLGNCAGDR